MLKLVQKDGENSCHSELDVQAMLTAVQRANVVLAEAHLPSYLLLARQYAELIGALDAISDALGKDDPYRAKGIIDACFSKEGPAMDGHRVPIARLVVADDERAIAVERPTLR